MILVAKQDQVVQVAAEQLPQEQVQRVTHPWPPQVVLVCYLQLQEHQHIMLVEAVEVV
jgi:hypothetical protein